MVSAEATSAEHRTMLPFPLRVLLGDGVSITFDLEQETLELLNRPTTIGVNVEVEYTSVSNVVLGALFSRLVDSTDDFSVDLSQDFSREDVSQFEPLAFRPWMALEVLKPVPDCTRHLQCSGLDHGYGDFLDREGHLVGVTTSTIKVLGVTVCLPYPDRHRRLVEESRTNGVEEQAGLVPDWQWYPDQQLTSVIPPVRLKPAS